MWYIYSASTALSPLPVTPPVRQSIPPPLILELPPTAPLSTSPHPFVTRITPEPSPSAPVPQKKLLHATKPVIPPKPKVPTRWEIVNQYHQVIELDSKYLRIAVDSDRYGYKNQALIYYKKYLSISPSGPYANWVRARLGQLQSSP